MQIQIGPGVPAFTIVGLPDKAVAESRERVHLRSDLSSAGARQEEAGGDS